MCVLRSVAEIRSVERAFLKQTITEKIHLVAWSGYFAVNQFPNYL